MNEYENIKMTESEMMDSFNALRKKILLSKIAIGVGFIGIGACFIMHKVPFAIAMMVVFIGGASKLTEYTKQIKDISGNGILKKIFYEIFDDVDYNHDGHFEKAEIEEAGFGYPYHKINGTDLVTGQYNGKDIKLCDVELVGTSHSNSSSHDSTVFHGLWVIYDSGKEYDANLSICEMNSIEKKISDKGIEIDNPEFDKKYRVTSDDVVAGSNMLNDNLMRLILDFDEKANARSNIAFLRNGKIHIALNSNTDPFAVKSSDIENLKHQFMSRIKVITVFIDQL